MSPARSPAPRLPHVTIGRACAGGSRRAGARCARSGRATTRSPGWKALRRRGAAPRSRAVSGESPFDSTATASSRKPASARWSSRWSSMCGDGVAAERDEARVGKKRRELTATTDGTVRSPRRWRTRAGHCDTREVRACTRRQLELEERRRDLGFRRVTLVATQRGDLVPARTRHDEAGEHLRRQRPVDAHEVDERPPRRLREIIARDVAAEEDDLVHPLGAAGARCAVTTDAHEQAKTVAGAPPHVSSTARSTLASFSTVGGLSSCRSERPAPIRS